MRANPARQALAALGSAGWMVASAARGAVRDAIEQDDLARDRLAAAFARLGWRPMPVLAALGALIGVAIGTATARLLHTVYVERLVEPAVTRALARDVAPLVIGIFAAGRIAVETAVRLGAMRFGSELDALRVTGHDPVRYTVSPALAAILIATPLQLVLVFACGWAALALVLSQQVVTTVPVLADTTLTTATFRALLVGGGKALLFAVGALAVGAVAGSGTARGIGAIGREAMQAFTAGLLLIIAIAVAAVLLQ